MSTSMRTCALLALFFLLVSQCVADEARTDRDDDDLHILVRQNGLRVDRMKAPDRGLNRLVKNIIKGNGVAKALGKKKITAILRRIIRLGSCNVRLCFALDGSASISRKEYTLQKDLVNLIASLTAIDDVAEHSAVQYGLVNRNIYPDIDNNISKFLRAVRKSQSQQANKTFLGAGLGFCVASTLGASPGGKLGIVVLGDGRSNIGDGALQIVLDTITTQQVYAIGVGFPQRKSLLNEIATSDANVFSLKKYSDFAKIVSKVVLGLCK